MPKVSVVIVDYGKGLLRDCLDSLAVQTFRDFETIIVNNNLINRGFAGGCNEGIRKANGEYIALLNNDARAERRWLEWLVKAADMFPKAGMFSSMVIRPDGKCESCGCYVYPDGNGMCFARTGTRFLPSMGAQWFPSGCAALYRRSMFDQIGLFDESFFMYNEDTELGIRANRAGWEYIFVPMAIVTHQGSRNTLKKLYYVERNRIKIMMKHFTWRQIVASVPWMIRRYLKGGR
jgi:GT2 family glycosyltransferase